MKLWTRQKVNILAVGGLLLAAILAYPQPQLDLGSYASLLDSKVGASNQTNPLKGTVVVVTGATSGIGLGLATALHGLGATIAAVGRSHSKLDRLRLDLDGFDGEEGRVVPFVADLNDLGAVASAGEEDLVLIGLQTRI